jgi:ethanolamine utilization microcompartment shell protein EutS
MAQIYVHEAQSFMVYYSGTEYIMLAPGINNVDKDIFDKVVSHPTVDMYESLGWMTIKDGEAAGIVDDKTGLELTKEDLPVSDVNPKTGAASVRKATATK